jgi:hypothetical protein
MRGAVYDTTRVRTHRPSSSGFLRGKSSGMTNGLVLLVVLRRCDDIPLRDRHASPHLRQNREA